MEKTMPKSELIKEVARRTKYLKTPVGEIINTLEEVMNETIINNGGTIRFSCFEIGNKMIPAMKGINPKSGEPYDTKEHLVPYAKIRLTFKRLHRELTYDNEK